jgi:hypothetical protein
MRRRTATSRLTRASIRSNSRSWPTISSSTAWTLSLHRHRKRCHSLNPLTLTLMGVLTGKSLRHHVKLIPGETRIGRKVQLIAFQVTVMPAQTLIAHSIQLVHSIRSRSQAKLRTIPVAKVWTLLREEMLQVPRPALISPLHNLLLRRQVCLSIGNFCAIKTISRLTLNCQSTFTMTSGIDSRISWSLHPRKR